MQMTTVAMPAGMPPVTSAFCGAYVTIVPATLTFTAVFRLPLCGCKP
jgi:hypothetical protein